MAAGCLVALKLISFLHSFNITEFANTELLFHTRHSHIQGLHCTDWDCQIDDVIEKRSRARQHIFGFIGIVSY